jgi:ribose-phosphate pyrophosphokinase
VRIYTKAGDLAFKTFTFPDGQPHFKLETYEREFGEVTIETALKSPNDLFVLAMAVSVLRDHGYSSICLDCRYLVGARMDRAISVMDPFTLQLVARWINGLGLAKVRILDVHSEVATRLIRNSENKLPWRTVQQVIHTCKPTALVCPDKGAVQRMLRLQDVNGQVNTVWCSKLRNPETGALSGFGIQNYDPNPNSDGQELLIVDDICDGGGTFVGLAKELRKAGAKKVYLYVTHGIFSKGLPIEGIDRIYTTDSYEQTCYMYIDSKEYKGEYKITIPISMKELN